MKITLAAVSAVLALVGSSFAAPTTSATKAALAVREASVSENPASTAAIQRRWTGGWCTFHLIQYQKTDPSDPNSWYGYVITALYDGSGTEIGSGDSPVYLAGGTFADLFDGLLNNPIALTAGNVDADPVYFAYGSETWDTSDTTYCSQGGYQDGSRNIDCGFTC